MKKLEILKQSSLNNLFLATRQKPDQSQPKSIIEFLISGTEGLGPSLAARNRLIVLPVANLLHFWPPDNNFPWPEIHLHWHGIHFPPGESHFLPGEIHYHPPEVHFPPGEIHSPEGETHFRPTEIHFWWPEITFWSPDAAFRPPHFWPK